MRQYYVLKSCIGCIDNYLIHTIYEKSTLLLYCIYVMKTLKIIVFKKSIIFACFCLLRNLESNILLTCSSFAKVFSSPILLKYTISFCKRWWSWLSDCFHPIHQLCPEVWSLLQCLHPSDDGPSCEHLSRLVSSRYIVSHSGSGRRSFLNWLLISLNEWISSWCPQTYILPGLFKILQAVSVLQLDSTIVHSLLC